MYSILIVATGSALGGVLRYGSQLIVHRLYPSAFPLGTFFVNLVGCLLIGLFFGLGEKANMLSADARLFLITGFCGGFTTFSTLSMDNLNLIRTGHLAYFMLYAIGSVVLGLLATYFGMFIMKAI